MSLERDRMFHIGITLMHPYTEWNSIKIKFMAVRTKYYTIFAMKIEANAREESAREWKKYGRKEWRKMREERKNSTENVESLAENGTLTKHRKNLEAKKIMRMKLTNYARYSFEDIKVTRIR